MDYQDDLGWAEALFVLRRHNRGLHLAPRRYSAHSHSRLRIGTLEQSKMLSMGSLANT
jgi:hypothetical protein